MNTQAEKIWHSKEVTPAGDPFMRIKKARGYYYYAERGGVDSIAFILYNDDTEEFALIRESKPPVDEKLGCCAMMTTAFGGSIDMNCSAEDICITEVREESGYDVTSDNVKFVGKTLVSTQMSQECFLYLVDVTGLKKTHLTEFETSVSQEQALKDTGEFSGNSVEWMSVDEVMENSDWKSIFIMMKAVHLDFL